uniref:Selenoprotein F/M domain-containing protein n=1 Tax=Lotharella globosa TaxID=91324 RepID=A0A6V3UPP7_9EUKA|mmetsp:Transcript_27240/g.53076  ORF Transcript_27240/g.53076 Transcript_27240/m.53076 type:complete len:174 (-) Transcript_27240:151-672(-)
MKLPRLGQVTSHMLLCIVCISMLGSVSGSSATIPTGAESRPTETSARAEEGYGIIMTPAGCKMKKLYAGTLKFIEKTADFYPQLNVVEVDHVQNPKLQIYTTKEARDRSILKTDEITEENMAALLEESQRLSEGSSEVLLDKEIGSMEPAEIESLLLKHNVQKLPGLALKEEL